ncbi:MAG: trypsin-like peptidase domain-containing protein [Desulfovibrionaceae bacterium]|nr:trypsin-like peptidase domain-containing protein [Desulfovibrionaceae bacterium]MBF0512983.1 trypsin-like peptidase domain-containing protein [Desulfovibrionaceae bacterium]
MGKGKNLAVAASIVFAAVFMLSSGCIQKQVPPPAVNNPIEVPTGKGTKSIALAAMIVKVPRGSEIGTIGIGLGCIERAKITCGSGKFNFSDSEFNNIFFEDLKRLHYNVVGNPNDIFNDKSPQAEIVVGGLITGMNLNICYPTKFNYERKEGKSNSAIEIEWQIYNALDRKTIYKKATKGSATSDFSNGNTKEALYLAFSNALGGLLEDKTFYAIVSGKAPRGVEGQTAGVPDEAPAKASSDNLDLSLTYSKAVPGKDHKSLADAQKSVVTVITPGGSGSGFIVSNDGLVITNYHVVTELAQVRILTHDGRKLPGRVVRRDARRDVAAVLVGGLDIAALKIRTDKLIVGEEVYAIGSPHGADFSGSVSKGIISTVELRKYGGKDWIQSDTQINHGNSGGPLIDAKGNVLGISTRGVPDFPQLNLFIPIAEAVDVLGINPK